MFYAFFNRKSTFSHHQSCLELPFLCMLCTTVVLLAFAVSLHCVCSPGLPDYFWSTLILSAYISNHLRRAPSFKAELFPFLSYISYAKYKSLFSYSSYELLLMYAAPAFLSLRITITINRDPLLSIALIINNNKKNFCQYLPNSYSILHLMDRWTSLLGVPRYPLYEWISPKSAMSVLQQRIWAVVWRLFLTWWNTLTSSRM